VAIDVRLSTDANGTWQVTGSVVPPRPSPAWAPTGPVTRTAREVLATPRIVLSGPAQHDVASGRVQDRILAVLLAVGREHELRVHVAVTGHPGTVHPTTRLSNHAVGRALDIRAIDGLPVGPERIEPVLAVMTAAAGAGATEVGGPIALDGRGFFTDPMHKDHVHIGVTPGKPSAAVEATAR
jgi:hypothetical protein